MSVSRSAALRSLQLSATALAAGLLLSGPLTARAELFTHTFGLGAESSMEPVAAENGQLIFAPTVRYYTTNSNYGPDGTLEPVAGLQAYRRLQSDLGFAYGMNSRFTLFGNFNWTRVQLEHTIAAVNFRPGDQTVGLSHRLLQTRGGFGVRLHAQVSFPAYDNAQAAINGDPYMGDGSIDTTVGALVTYGLDRRANWKLQGGAGYTYRTDGFSGSIPWSAGVSHAARGDTLILRAGLSGFASLKNDPNAQGGGRDSGGAGGSYFINAMNPSILNLQLEAGYRLSEGMGLTAAFSRSVWGQAAPIGTQVSFGIQTSLLRPERATKPAHEYEGSNKGFVSYDFEARVVSTNDRLNLVKIDQGSDAGVRVGQIFDIFSVKANGSPEEAVARARCTHVKAGEAALKITEYFREVWIEERFIVKRPLN